MVAFMGSCAEIFHFSYKEILYEIPYNKLLLMFTNHNDNIIKQNKSIEKNLNSEKEKNFKPYKVGKGANGMPVMM